MTTPEVSIPLTVEITSFSYKLPLPEHLFSWNTGRHGGGFVFDCRSLPNPGREERFSSLTGLDPLVAEFLEVRAPVQQFRDHVFALIDSTVETYIRRGFTCLSVGFGCTGGQHRSVYFAEALALHLSHTFGSQVTPLVHHPSLKSKGLLS